MRNVRAIALLVVCAAPSALAGTVPVQNPPGSEKSHKQIIDHIYGASFTGSPAAGFVGTGPRSGVTVSRVADFGLGGPLHLGGSGDGADDQVWANGVISVSAKARFAGFSQSFGFFPGTGASAMVPLFSVTGSGFGVSGQTADFDIGAVTHEWRWARSGQNGPHSSRNSDNADGRDHMVTYRVDGLDNRFGATWLLFFEDKNANQNSDWDYNDLVVEIHVRTPVIPAPSAGLAAGAGLLGLASRRRRAR